MKVLMLLMLCASVCYSQVWVCDDGTRVMQDDTAHWSRYDYDTCWNGTTVNLVGAKNEILAFQIIIHGTETGLDSVNVSFDTLQCGASYIKNTVGADSTLDVGRPIQLFVEHYIEISSLTSSPSRWVLGNCTAGATPDDSVWLGWVPDGLVPIKAKRGTYDHGQGGGPFDIAADKVQGVWCDVYIPKSSPAGTYTGNIRVWQGTSITQSIPVSLIVKNFTLPDSTHTRAYVWLDWAPFSGAVPEWVIEDSVEMQNQALFQKMMNLFHRNRLGAVNSTSFEVFSHANGYQQYLTGTGYSAEKGYDGPGVGVGGNFYAIGQFLQPWAASLVGFNPSDRSTWGPAADTWEDYFAANLPNTAHALYMWDEPFNENKWYDSLTTYGGKTVRFPFYWIGTLHDSISASSGSGKNLDIMLTTAHLDAENYEDPYYWPDLEDLGIDWYVAAGRPAQWVGYNVDENTAGRTAADLRAMGNHVGCYNDERPAWGMMPYVAYPPTELRAGFLAMRKYDVDLWFTWNAAYGWGKWRFPTADTADVRYFGPWNSATAQYTSLVYPGKDPVWIPGDDRDWDGPIPSIRLAMLRRGLQDCEYIWLADSAGLNVDSILNVITPNGMNDSTGGWNVDTDPPTYEHPNKFFEDIRLSLASQLAQPAEESSARNIRRRVIRKQWSTE